MRVEMADDVVSVAWDEAAPPRIATFTPGRGCVIEPMGQGAGQAPKRAPLARRFGKQTLIRLDQAMGRAHRIGQQRPVTVYRLVSKGSIEERIVDLHHEKRALADSILDEGDASTLPATDDLIALIRGD